MSEPRQDWDELRERIRRLREATPEPREEPRQPTRPPPRHWADDPGDREVDGA